MAVEKYRNYCQELLTRDTCDGDESGSFDILIFNTYAMLLEVFFGDGDLATAEPSLAKDTKENQARVLRTLRSTNTPQKR